MNLLPKTPMRKPSSPCTKVCVLDGPSGLCVGCGRTRDEIASWGTLSEPQRLAVMAGLAERLAKASPPFPPVPT